MKKTLALLVAGTLALGSARAGSVLWTDDFSSGSLNPARWTQTTFNGRALPQEVGVSDGAYRVGVTSAGDREVVLSPNYSFQAGDKLMLDLIYVSGTGNNLMNTLVNDSYPTKVEPQTTPNPGSGTIGYWNGAPDTGSEFGTYHLEYLFFNDRVQQTTTRPDGTTIQHTLYSANSIDRTLGINIHTGHDGLTNMNIDNVTLETIPEPGALGLGIAGLLALGLKRKKIFN
jgi:hypothetical protein